MCSTFTVIFNPGDLLFSQDYQHLRRPWVDNPTATVATSVTISQGIHSLLQLQVPGLDGETVESIIQKLQQSGCLSFIIGEMVQDQILDVSTTAIINLQSNCDADTLYNICLEKWGSSKCSHLSRGSNIVNIGDVETMHGIIYPTISASWNETFFGNGTSLFYTTNSIAYFANGLNVIIDITGQGVSDTCYRIIRIPVSADMREQWVSPEKLFLFWKLRVMGYRAADSDTLSYIVSKTKTLIMETPEQFQNIYCSTILSGQFNNSTCSILNVLCSEALSQKEIFDATFEMDLDVFWSDTVKPIIDGLEYEYCTIEDNMQSGGRAINNVMQYLLFICFVEILNF